MREEFKRGEESVTFFRFFEPCCQINELIRELGKSIALILHIISSSNAMPSHVLMKAVLKVMIRPFTKFGIEVS